MTNLKRLSVGMAAVAACLASAGVANAAVPLVTLTATYVLQSYTTTAKDSIKFVFDATTPSNLTYSRFVGTFEVDGDTVGPFTGVGSYSLPGFTAKGITINYELTPTVPETATWAMMIIGLGAIGIAARRRQNVNVTYA